MNKRNANWGQTYTNILRNGGMRAFRPRSTARVLVTPDIFRAQQNRSSVNPHFAEQVAAQRIQATGISRHDGAKGAEFQRLKSTLLGHTFLKNEVTDLLPGTSQLDLERETERETEKGNRKSWIRMDLQKTIRQHCN